MKPPEVIYPDTPDLKDKIDWFLAGDLSLIACDTETMGRQWLQLRRELYPIEGWEKATRGCAQWEFIKERRDKLEKVKKEALNPRKNHLATVQLCTADYRTLILVNRDEELRQFLAGFLGSLIRKVNPVWVFQNAKFDFHQFSHHLQIDFTGQRIHDTQLCGALIKGAGDNLPVGLAQLCEDNQLPAEFRKEEDAEERVSDWWTSPLTDKQITYAARDVQCLLMLYDKQRAHMIKNGLHKVRHLECNFISRLRDIEDVGARVDREKLSQFIAKADEVIKTNELTFRAVFGEKVNPYSPAQMLAAIETQYGITPKLERYDAKKRTFVEVPSTDKVALLESGLLDMINGGPRYPEMQAYIAMRETRKNKTEAETWKELPDGKLFVNFHQLQTRSVDKSEEGGARTGRMSTSPQLNNISNLMKQFIVAPDGWAICSSDFAGEELRVVAALANEENMLQALRNGRSLHMEMAVEMGTPLEELHKKHPAYRIGKEANFGFIYWMSGRRFSKKVFEATHGEIKLTPEEGWAAHAAFFEKWPGIQTYHMNQLAYGAIHGYVETRSGRRRYYNHADRPVLDRDCVRFRYPGQTVLVNPKEHHDWCYRAADWRWRNVTANTPVQGTCADIIKLALTRLVDKFRGMRAQVFASVYDSIDYFVQEDKVAETVPVVDSVMKEAFKYYIPEIAGEIEHTAGRSWAAAPKDIRKEDRGLWIIDNTEPLEQWKDREFQKEFHL